MGRLVRNVIRACDSCQKTKFPNRYAEGPLQNIIPSKPKELYAVDIYGPLPKTKFNNKYVFVVLDVFSKFVQIYPLNKPTAKNCLNKLINYYFKLCGVPECVLSDHGTQFTSHVWKQNLHDLGVQAMYSSIRRPQKNPSERVMRELSRIFRTFCFNDHKSWFNLIPQINCWFNNLTHEATGYTPMEVHFGRRPSREVDKEFLIPEIYNKRRRAQKAKLVTFDVNDSVLLRTPKVSDSKAQLFHKFFHSYSGPFRVSRIIGPNACHLVDSNNKDLGIQNFANLKRYYPPSWSSSPSKYRTIG
ncbi:hypothetical protein J437_LFUL006412, partial [Ladona fulva]